MIVTFLASETDKQWQVVPSSVREKSINKAGIVAEEGAATIGTGSQAETPYFPLSLAKAGTEAALSMPDLSDLCQTTGTFERAATAPAGACHPQHAAFDKPIC